jgi:hypothetical protein
MSWPLNTWIAKRTATQWVILNDRVAEALWHEAGHRSAAGARSYWSRALCRTDEMTVDAAIPQSAD